jgi:hypothetical protein
MSQGNGNGVVVLELPARLSWDGWCARVHEVGLLKKKLPFYVGDLLLYGEQTFGEKASQLINSFGYSEGALSNLRYVAKRFPPEERTNELSWSMYQAIAPFDKRTREKLIVRALSGELKRADIRALSAENNGNGASDDSEGSPRLKTAKAVALEGLGLAMAATARLYKGQNVANETWAEALDELIAKAMILRGMVV